MNARWGFVALALFGMLIVGCGQGGGSGLTGVTGGGEDGYGGGIMHFDTGGGGEYGGLIGTWRHDYDYADYVEITFDSSGGFSGFYYYYGDTYSWFGTYQVSGNQLTTTVDGEEETGFFSISADGNQLTLVDQDGDEFTYYKVG